jgi:hypothetical protein
MERSRARKTHSGRHLRFHSWIRSPAKSGSFSGRGNDEFNETTVGRSKSFTGWFNHHEILHEDMDRDKILDWESQLQEKLDDHRKYDKAGKRRVRSLGRKAPYLLYLAWRHIDWRPQHNPKTWTANRALIEEAKRQSANNPGTLTMHPNDRSLRWTTCRYATYMPPFLIL